MKKFYLTTALLTYSALLLGTTAYVTCNDTALPSHAVLSWATPYKFSVYTYDADAPAYHWLLVESGQGLGYRKTMQNANIEGRTFTRGYWRVSKYDTNSCGQPMGYPILIKSFLVP